MNQLMPFSASITGALFSAVWEGAVLTVVVMLCLRMFPRLSAAARSVIWLNVFVLLALLHILPACAHSAAHVPQVSPVHLDARWSLAIAGVWMVLSIWRAGQLVMGAVHLRGLVRRAKQVEVDSSLQAILERGPQGRSAKLYVSNEITRPSVLGFVRPRVLLTPALLETLSAQELQQVVLHEMEHLRRGDDWTNLLQKIGLVLFPLNPVLLWVERKLCAERELACDDRVMQAGCGRKAYALCLARLAEHSLLQRGFSLALGALERRPELVRRVQRILSRPVQTMGRKAALLTTGGLLSGALASALVLAHSPQLVSFAPAMPNVQTRAIEPLDLNELGKELGGKPQLVKAVMPEQPVRVHPVRKAVLKRPVRRNPEPARIAAAQLPDLQTREAIVVMTEWSDAAPVPRVMISVYRERGANPAAIIPARFAAVPTPNGWLILQI